MSFANSHDLLRETIKVKRVTKLRGAIDKTLAVGLSDASLIEKLHHRFLHVLHAPLLENLLRFVS